MALRPEQPPDAAAALAVAALIQAERVEQAHPDKVMLAASARLQAAMAVAAAVQGVRVGKQTPHTSHAGVATAYLLQLQERQSHALVVVVAVVLTGEVLD